MEAKSNALCRLLGITHPIIQSPMTGTSTPELAAAVSNAGGLGSLGCANMTEEGLRTAVGKLRALTNRGFNLNFFVHPPAAAEPAEVRRAAERLAPYYRELSVAPPDGVPGCGAGFDAAKLRSVLDRRPAVVSFHFGLPEPSLLSPLREAGILIISTATTVAEARFLARSGVDAIIAQGHEAGGHRGSHVPRDAWDGIGLMSLVPQVVDAVEQPVIAAGGISDGRGIAAALALGASGVQIGTAFTVCPEAATDEARLALLGSASDTDTMMTDAFSGRAARAARSRFALEMARDPAPLLPYPLHYALTNDLVAAAAGGGGVHFHLYGQSASLARRMPASELVQLLAAETRKEIERLLVWTPDSCDKPG